MSNSIYFSKNSEVFGRSKELLIVKVPEDFTEDDFDALQDNHPQDNVQWAEQRIANGAGFTLAQIKEMLEQVRDREGDYLGTLDQAISLL